MTDLAPTPSPGPNVIYGMFVGNIEQATLQRLFSSFDLMMKGKVTHLHLLFQSSGGYVGDGVALYNLFRAMPFDLTLYNVGNVYSIASISFLGAKHRRTSTYASFMLHRSIMSPQAASVAKLRAVTQSLAVDDVRTEAILREHLTLSDEQWQHLGYHDLTFSGSEAVAVGLAHEVAEFAPPAGQQIFNLG